MEKLLLGALRRAPALEGLARFVGERAIFTRASPADLEYDGASYPHCVLNWRPVRAYPRLGTAVIDVVALDEGGFSPAAAAEALRAELDGMIFGGESARALCWRAALEFDGGDAARTPRVVGATLEFEAYELSAPASGLEAELNRAVGALLGAGYADARSADTAGEIMKVAPYSLTISSLAREKAAPGCEFGSFEAALKLPGASREAAYEAQRRLGATGVLKLSAGAALIDSIRLAPNADGYAQGQIALRGRVNMLEKGAPGQALNAVSIAGAIELDI